MSGVHALRFDAGSLSLNLVATVGRRFRAPVERLTSVDRLRDWLGEVGLSVRGPLGEADVDRVRRFREHLEALFRSAVAGTRPPADALAEVNAVMSVPRLRGLELATPTLDAVIALIAADAVRIVAGRERNDLRVCEAADCRMLYLGYGRRARRWCSSERCGNRSRVAAHRARAAAGR